MGGFQPRDIRGLPGSFIVRLGRLFRLFGVVTLTQTFLNSRARGMGAYPSGQLIAQGNRRIKREEELFAYDNTLRIGFGEATAIRVQILRNQGA